MGEINRLEELQISGMGEIVRSHFDKYTQKEEKYTNISIKESDFDMYYEIIIRDDVAITLYTVSGIVYNKYTKIKPNKVFLLLQGVSYSSVLVSMLLQVGHG